MPMPVCFYPADRERDSSERDFLRARDRLWRESSVRDLGASSSSGKGADSPVFGDSKKTNVSQQSQNLLVLGEDLEWWPDKVWKLSNLSSLLLFLSHLTCDFKLLK